MFVDEFLIKLGVDTSQAQKIDSVIQSIANLGKATSSKMREMTDSIGLTASESVKSGAAAKKALKETSSAAKEVTDSAERITDSLSKTGDEAKKSGAKTTKALNDTEKAAQKAKTGISKLKIAFAALTAGAVLYGNKIVSAFSSAITNAEQVANQKNALFKISKQEIAQANEYRSALEKQKLAIDGVKTKIALNLAPALTNIIQSFTDWISVNKELISDSISKVIKIVLNVIQVIKNTILFIDKIISSTIGWKNALIILGIAWAAFNRALLFSPLGIIIGLVVGLMLVIDDLMTYLRGGDSLLGEYWEPLIKGTKKITAFIKTAYREWKAVLVGIGTYFGLLLGVGLAKKAVSGFLKIGKAFKTLQAIFMANPIIAIISIIAMLAYYIYENWDWLSGWFSELWGNICGIFISAWNWIVSTVSDAIKSVLKWFGMSEDGAESTVAAIGGIFSAILGFITAPFKAAWAFIKGLFGIWTDDSLSFVDKLGATFASIYELATKPFKLAISWVKEKIFGLLSWVTGKFGSILSYFGIDINVDSSDLDELSTPEDTESEHLIKTESTDTQNSIKHTKETEDKASDNKVNNAERNVKDNIENNVKNSKSSNENTVSNTENNVKNNKVTNTKRNIKDDIENNIKNSKSNIETNEVISTTTKNKRIEEAVLNSNISAELDKIKSANEAVQTLSDSLFGFIKSAASSCVDFVSGAFSAVTDAVVAPFQWGFEFVSGLFSESEDEASGLTNKLSTAFSAVTGFVCAPFKAAWDFVKAIFNVWSDSTLSFVDKVGKSFSYLYDFVTKPFKMAIGWIKDKFMGFIDSVIGKAAKLLSYIGIDIDIGTKEDDVDMSDEGYKFESAQAKLEALSNQQAIAQAPQVASNTTNQSKVVNQGDMTNNITINTSDNSVGADQLSGIYTEQLVSATFNANQALRGF